MNNTYNAIYECQLCKERFRVNQEAFEADPNTLPNMIMGVIHNQQLAGNPYLYQAPMYVPHNCSNGDTGVAMFIGFRKVGNNTSKKHLKFLK